MADARIRGAGLLRAWREDNGLSLQAAAQMFDVSAPTVCDYEHGNKIPKVAPALRIAAATDGAVPVGAWVSS